MQQQLGDLACAVQRAALAAIMAAALILRLYAIERIPAVVFHDECDNLVNVYQILNGRGPDFFGFDWKPQPAASVYLLSLSMRLGMSTGNFAAGGRTLQRRGTASVLPVVAPGRDSPRGAAGHGLAGHRYLVSALLAQRLGEHRDVSVPHGWSAVCPQRYAYGPRASFVWAGAWSAFGAYGYFDGRSVVPTLLLSGALSLLRPWVSGRRLLSGVGLMTCTAALLVAPQLSTVVRHWDRFQHRSRAVYILAGENEHKSAGEKIRILAESLAGKAYQLFSKEIPGEYERPDRYLRVEDGALVRPTVLLLGIGMLSSIFWFSETWLWWVLFLVPFGLTEVVTTGSLDGARGIVFVPVVYLFVGLSLEAAWRLCTRIYRPLTAVVVGGVLVLCA